MSTQSKEPASPEESAQSRESPQSKDPKISKDKPDELSEQQLDKVSGGIVPKLPNF